MKRFVAGVIVGALLTAGVTVVAESSVVRLFVDGKEVSFAEAPPQFIGNRVMVPARPLAEALGAKVEWDAAGRTVLVVTGSTDSPIEPGFVPVRTLTDSYGLAGRSDGHVLRLSGNDHSADFVMDGREILGTTDSSATIRALLINGRLYVHVEDCRLAGLL